MAGSDYDESPRSSIQRRRKNSRAVPPAVPDVPSSPPRRRRDRGREESRHRESDWDRRQDEERLLRTPESRASSSSYHPSHRRYYDYEYRRDRSTTPSHSVASSMTSVRAPQPPRSSVTRQSNSLYRQPSVSARAASSAGYEDDYVLESRMSHHQPRSIPPRAPSARLSRRSSRTLRSTSVSSIGSSQEDNEEEEDDDDDVPYDSHEDSGRLRLGHGENRLVRVNRDDDDDDDDGDMRVGGGLRSRSRADTERRGSYRRQVRHEESLSLDEEDPDEIDPEYHHKHYHQEHHPPPARQRPRDRTPSRQRPRSPSRAASVRHVQGSGNDIADDADSDEPPPRDLRDRFERRESRKHHRHDPAPSREHRRNRSESQSKRSPPSARYVLSAALTRVDPGSGSSRRVRSSSKRYYESEAPLVERRDRYHPPSTSLRRSSTVSGSGSVAAASQHQSVSSSTKRSSLLGSFFGSPRYGHSHHHHASGKPVKTVECVVCMDDLPPHKATKLKCGHRMCNSCLKRSFKLSITDPQHMPPKCCTTDLIPLRHVDRLFDIQFKKTWNKKFIEYSARNRIYCPKRSCGEFIRPEDLRHTSDGKKYGKCPKCGTKACVQCSGKWHRDRDCPKDEETTRLLAQAKEEGWQRCIKCRVLVELKEGCNHITCLCGAEFCYICGARWKTCACPWFNYEAVENDRLQHMQVPMLLRDRFGPRPTVDLPPSPQRDSRPRLRPWPQTYEEEMLLRRQQEERDETLARRLHNYRDYNDEHEEDFLAGFGDITGLGNAAGHFMNEDFRPRPRNIVVPQAPPPPHNTVPLEPAPIFERAPAGGYVQDVNRARRPRATSLTRLAERFKADRPTQRPPPPLPTAATMPLPTMVPALAPEPPIRRGTVEVPGAGRVLRAAAPVYAEPEELSKPKGSVSVRKQHVRDSPTDVKQSALAGLTGDGRYKNRVDEWRTYVGQDPGEPAADLIT